MKAEMTSREPNRARMNPSFFDVPKPSNEYARRSMHGRSVSAPKGCAPKSVRTGDCRARALRTCSGAQLAHVSVFRKALLEGPHLRKPHQVVQLRHRVGRRG